MTDQEMKDVEWQYSFMLMEKEILIGFLPVSAAPTKEQRATLLDRGIYTSFDADRSEVMYMPRNLVNNPVI